jgi:hypothetical protein
VITLLYACSSNVLCLVLMASSPSSSPQSTGDVPSSSSVLAAWHHRKAVTAAYHAKRRAAATPTTTTTSSSSSSTTIANESDRTTEQVVMARQLPVQTYDSFASSFHDIDRKDVIAERIKRTAQYAAANAITLPHLPSALVALSASLATSNIDDHAHDNNDKDVASTSALTTPTASSSPSVLPAALSSHDAKPIDTGLVATSSPTDDNTNVVVSSTAAPHLQRANIPTPQHISFSDPFTPLPTDVPPPSSYDVDAMLPLSSTVAQPRFESPPFPGVSSTPATDSQQPSSKSDPASIVAVTPLTALPIDNDDDEDDASVIPAPSPLLASISPMVSLPLSLLSDFATIPTPSSSSSTETSTNTTPSTSSFHSHSDASITMTPLPPSTSSQSSNTRPIGDLRKRFETIQMIEEMRQRERAATNDDHDTKDVPENNDVVQLREVIDDDDNDMETSEILNGTTSTRQHGDDATESEPLPSTYNTNANTKRKSSTLPASSASLEPSRSTTMSSNPSSTSATAPLVRDADEKEEIVIDVDNEVVTSSRTLPTTTKAVSSSSSSVKSKGSWSGPTANGSYIFEENKRKSAKKPSTIPSSSASIPKLATTTTRHDRSSNGIANNDDNDDDNSGNDNDDDEAADRDDIWAFERDRKQDIADGDTEVEYWDYREFDDKGNAINKSSTSVSSLSSSSSVPTSVSSSTSSSSVSMFPRGPPVRTDALNTSSSSTTARAAPISVSVSMETKKGKKLPNLLDDGPDDFDVFDPEDIDDNDDNKKNGNENDDDDGDGVTLKRTPLVSVDGDQIETVALDPVCACYHIACLPARASLSVSSVHFFVDY